MSDRQMDVTLKDDAIKMLRALEFLHNESGRLMNEFGGAPQDNSPAKLELSNFSEPKFVRALHDQSNLLIDIVADHQMAFIRMLKEPVLTIAPWVCVRSIIETSALAKWLLDSNKDTKTRIKRSLSLRYKGLMEQNKFANASGKNSASKKVIQQIDKLEKRAIEIGYKKIVDTNEKRIGIAMQMPSSTMLIGEVLNKEPVYRFLSAVAHGHLWAAKQLGFKTINIGGQLFIEKHLEVKSVAYLCKETLDCIANSFWHQCRLFGWDVARFETILDQTYDSFGNVGKNVRFWVK